MHKYITLFFSVILFLSACKSDKVPDGIIQPDRMTNLLTDVHLTDGAMYTVRQDPDSLYKYGYGKYHDLLKKYHTDTVQFRKSIKYYSTNRYCYQKCTNRCLSI